MESKTEQIIEKLNRLKSKQEIIDLIESKHYAIKAPLVIAGVRFYDEGSSFPQDIRGGQLFKSREEKQVVKLYEEINFIRKGLTKEWVYNSPEKARFEKIKNEVENIISELETKIK